MSQKVNSNQNQQENEILLLSNIYNCNEFSYSKGDIIQCYFNVFLQINGDLLQFVNIYKSNKDFESDLFPQISQKYFVEYLPPIRMYLQLSYDYPTKNSPHFFIISSWLSPWQISLICQQLDEIWLDNKGQEILFLWFEFLRNDLLDFLQIKNTLDVSFLYMVYYDLQDYFKLNLMFKSDVRVVYNPLFFDPIQFFKHYDKYRCETKFKEAYYECAICLQQHVGEKCLKLKNCSHVYCKKCIGQYTAIKINEGNINDIICPSINCSRPIAIGDIKNLCPTLFSKYECLSLNLALNTMKDIIFCPRTSCQYAFIKDTSETLIICCNCDYAFCSYCFKAYHGGIPCAMTICDTKKLIQNYKCANKEQQKLLEKKYGRKQIQILVHSYLTNEYLKSNAKACPNCQTMITKIDGCNKMKCIYCKACFCWLCGIHITTQNAYNHFLYPESQCYKRLFN